MAEVSSPDSGEAYHNMDEEQEAYDDEIDEEGDVDEQDVERSVEESEEDDNTRPVKRHELTLELLTF